MQAIIFANRNGNELAPLDSHYCPALLPVGNKPVIEFTLEDLAAAQIDKVRIVISSQSAQIEKLVGNGEKWGLEVEYFLSREQEAVSTILPRLSLNADEAILLARADMLRSPCIKSFVEFSKQMANNHVIAKLANQNAGLMMLPGAKLFTKDLNWPITSNETSSDDLQTITQVLHGDCYMLDSLQNYMDANQALASKKIIGMTPKGRYFSSGAKEQGFYIGAKTKSAALTMHNAWGVIGQNTWIDDSVDMQQSIVVGKNCLIEKACSLKNCLILDNSYVGQGLNVTNAIISKDLLIKPESCGHLALVDASIISENRQVVNAKQKAKRVTTIDRLQALTLFSIGLLLAPLLLVISFLSHPKQPVVKETIFIKGAKRTSHRWNISSLFIARLPQLYWVISGKLALFGASPFEQKITTPNLLEHVEIPSLPGLYGPLQLVIDVQAPTEERQLIEAEYLCMNQRNKYWLLVAKSMSGKTSQPARDGTHSAQLKTPKSAINQ
ncbi:sugar phosphate nucleotidyltransferase [Shewanella kaireitica]|uniref:sugar phosphate nucleotidyltransferase n=1 Tax=Shewanella kaireitica TaxID=212021 RepID=UPI00200D2FAE|nr:NDP-sugar synthase [Shewanella kaireitica]MCL1095747.1 NDP-sugar synthase [Shewanella kaireitica]